MASKLSADALPIIEDIRKSGAVSLGEIAAELDERGIQTRRGGDWTAVQVQRVLQRGEYDHPTLSVPQAPASSRCRIAAYWHDSRNTTFPSQK
jgi:hypothetical protein